MKSNYFAFLLFVTVSFTSVTCQFKDRVIQLKNSCYRNELRTLMQTPLYITCHEHFRNYIDSIKPATKLFSEKYMEVKIDDVMFLKADSTECLLFLLLRDRETTEYSFGSARTFYGKKNGNTWSFAPGMTFSFDPDYLEMYADNGFSNISELGVHSVLTSGNPPILGCNLDDHFWFVELRE
jgi:hypothetical protein